MNFQIFKKKDPPSLQLLKSQLFVILQISIALCFIGHGAWGVIGKQGWIPYFHTMGISSSHAVNLMPIVGTLDIILGFLILIHPNRILLFYMAGWAFWTALLRPLTDQSLWEVWERSGNYLPPVLLLILMGVFRFSLKDWLSKLKEVAVKLTVDRVNMIEILSRMALALLLLGHGGFFFFDQKALLSKHLASIGLPDSPQFLMVVGLFEFVLAFMCLISSRIFFFLFILIWKVFCELLYPISGSFLDIFEFIERAGDYGIPLALVYILQWREATNTSLLNITRKKAKSS